MYRRFSVVGDDLDAYLKDGSLSKYEVTGRHLILYMAEIAGSESLSFSYLLRANMPVCASDGGSKVYPYYEPDQVTSAPATTLLANES